MSWKFVLIHTETKIMMVWGKILGAFFGFLLGGPIGLAFGLYFGHKFDKARQNYIFNGGTDQFARQQAYFYNTFSVMGHLAKAKGQVTQEEIRLASNLMDRMSLQGQARKEAQNAFREGKASDFPIEKVLSQVRANCSGRFDLLRFFLEMQIQAAFADGNIHPAEYQVLVKIATHLGFSRRDLDQHLAMQEAAFQFRQQGGNYGHQQWGQQTGVAQLEKAYQILGVSKNDDAQEIKKIYRKLMSEHHPDKLAAKGLPPEMMEIAKQKTQEIQAAYELIKKEKGIK